VAHAGRLFDAHFHIIDTEFPLQRNQGFSPNAFTITDYLTTASSLGLSGGVVVAGSFQSFDQSWLRAALGRLGPAYVGVAQLPASVDEATLRELNAAGVRAVRFNVQRGGSESIALIEAFAHRVHTVCGWHVELHADAAALAPLVPMLKTLSQVVIDHLGLSAAALPTLLALAERHAKVKATGFGRVTLDVASALRAIHAANPRALMFGTDLPCTRAPRPFSPQDIELLVRVLPHSGHDAVFAGNALELYRPEVMRRAAAADA